MGKATKAPLLKELTFFRCELCSGVVSVWDVNDGGCPKCNGVRIRPTNLTLWEKIVQLVKHPKIWGWPDDLQSDESR